MAREEDFQSANVVFHKLYRIGVLIAALLGPDLLTFTTMLFDRKLVGRVPVTGRRQDVRWDLRLTPLRAFRFHPVVSNPLASTHYVALMPRPNMDRILVQLWQHLA